jgi:hypothetical protein
MVAADGRSTLSLDERYMDGSTAITVDLASVTTGEELLRIVCEFAKALEDVSRPFVITVVGTTSPVNSLPTPAVYLRAHLMNMADQLQSERFEIRFV